MRANQSGMEVLQEREWLVASFPEPVRALSWAIVHGGLVDAERIAWREVTDTELHPLLDPVCFLADALERRELRRTVGMMTSHPVSRYLDVAAEADGAFARCLATVGLSNALRVGDPPGGGDRVGTINVLVHIELPLTDAALAEALSIATEARTLAVHESSVESRRTGLPATGTGTDCIVVTCLRGEQGGEREVYAGKHTAIGAVVGEAVYKAVREGVVRWVRDYGRARVSP